MVLKTSILYRREPSFGTFSQLCSLMECVAFHLLRRASQPPSSSVMYTVSDSWVALSECFSCPISHCIVHCMMFLCEFCCYGVVFASLLATKIIWVGCQRKSIYIHVYVYLHIYTVYVCVHTYVYIYTCMCRYIDIHMYIQIVYIHTKPIWEVQI